MGLLDSLFGKPRKAIPRKLEFDERRFTQGVATCGFEPSVLRTILTEIASDPKFDPQAAWTALCKMPPPDKSAEITKRLRRQASDFTDFCIQMCRETHCPPYMYASFWDLAKS